MRRCDSTGAAQERARLISSPKVSRCLSGLELRSSVSRSSNQGALVYRAERARDQLSLREDGHSVASVLSACLPRIGLASLSASLKGILKVKLLIFAVLLATSVSVVCVHAGIREVSDFVASGVVRTELHSGDQVKVWTNFFEVTMSACKYYVSVKHPADLSASLEETCLFDGTNAYFVLHNDPAWQPTNIYFSKNGRLLNLPVTNKLHLANEIDMVVGSGPRPPAKFDTLVLAWLALASWCYYDGHQTSSEESLFFLGPQYSWHHIKLDTLLVFQQLDWGFLSQRVEMHDGLSYNVPLREGHDLLTYWEARSKKLSKRRLPAPYQGGYTNSLYWVDAWTNAMGVSFPRVFRMERLSQPQHGGQSIMLSSVGTLINVMKPADLSVLKPRFGRGARITETRPSVLGFEGEYSDRLQIGIPLGRTEMQKSEEYRRFMSQGGQMRSVGLGRALIYVLFAVLLLIPAAMFVKKKGLTSKPE